MKNLKKYLLLSIMSIALVSCNDDDTPVANDVILEFHNTFGEDTIVLGNATSAEASVNTSDEGQTHHFSELKYIISNIRLVKTDGTEIPYHINDLDNGATIIDQANSETLQYVLKTIPTAEYAQIKFGLGVKAELNLLNEEAFPNFYAAAGAHDTQLHWYWATGYRFTKIEGFFGEENTPLSIHTGSVLGGDVDDESTWSSEETHARNAYRDISLALTTNAVVGENAPIIRIKADFKNLLSGTKSITLTAASDGHISGTAPSHHSSPDVMIDFVDNIGGNGDTDITGMFSIKSVEN